MTREEFYLQLQEEEEYMYCTMSKYTYSGIDHELRELMVSDVKQKNKAFEDNEEIQQLYKERSKIKRKITKAEFNINNK